jgi:hypothetical protein
MQARGFTGTFRHLASRRIGPTAWAAFALVVAALLGFELAGHLWLPRA